MHRATKTDELSEKFQTAFDPPPHFRKITLQILYISLNGYKAFKSYRKFLQLLLSENGADGSVVDGCTMYIQVEKI